MHRRRETDAVWRGPHRSPADAPVHGAVQIAGRPRQTRTMQCEGMGAAAGGTNRANGLSGRHPGAPRISTPALRTAIVYAVESRLSQRIPRIPANPAYPGESHLSQRIPLVPANPACPGESHLSRRIPLIPGGSRLSRSIPVNPALLFQFTVSPARSRWAQSTSSSPLATVQPISVSAPSARSGWSGRLGTSATISCPSSIMR